MMCSRGHTFNNALYTIAHGYGGLSHVSSSYVVTECPVCKGPVPKLDEEIPRQAPETGRRLRMLEIIVEKDMEGPSLDPNQRVLGVLDKKFFKKGDTRGNGWLVTNDSWVLTLLVEETAG